MDHFIQHFINKELICSFLDFFFSLITNFSLWKPVFILLIPLLFIFGNKKLRIMLLLLIATLTLSDGVFSNSLKHWVERPRPFQSEQGVRLVTLDKKTSLLSLFNHPPQIRFSDKSDLRSTGRSFPSSHAANVMAAACIISFFYPGLTLISIFIALLIGYSRIYVGVHWPSDVLTGWCLGAFIALSLLFFFKEFLKKRLS